MKESIQEIINAIKQKKFNNLSSGAKNILIVVISLVVLIPTFFYIFSTPSQDLSESFEKNLNANTNEVASETPPPKLENPFNKPKDEQKEAIKKDDSPKNAQIEEEANKKEVLEIINNTQSQEEAIKEIAKRQRPQDMMIFLKEIQPQIDFRKTQGNFKFENKIYKQGDIFLGFFEITSITENYLRFRDSVAGYEYNLRFID